LHAGGVITREGRGVSKITGRAAGAGAGAVAAAGYPVTFSVDLTAPRRGSVCRVLNRSSCSGSGFDSDFTPLHSSPTPAYLPLGTVVNVCGSYYDCTGKNCTVRQVVLLWNVHQGIN